VTPRKPPSREIAAYHEAGHALVASIRREVGRTILATIDASDLDPHNARKGTEAYGFVLSAWTLPIFVGRQIDRAQLEASLAYTMGGLAGELHLSGRPLIDLRDAWETTYAGGDLCEAFEIARMALQIETDELAARASAECGAEPERSDEIVRSHARALMDLAYEVIEPEARCAYSLVGERWPAVCAIARALLARGRLRADEIEALIEAAR